MPGSREPAPVLTNRNRSSRTRQRRTNPASINRLPSRGIADPELDLTSVTVTLSEYVTVTPFAHHANRNRVHGQLRHRPRTMPNPFPALACEKHVGAANVSLP